MKTWSRPIFCLLIASYFIAVPRESEAEVTRIEAIRVNPEGKPVEYGEIRESSSATSRLLGRVRTGVELQVRGEFEFGWFKVHVPTLGRLGWIHTSDALPLFYGENFRMLREARGLLELAQSPGATFQKRISAYRNVLALRRQAMGIYLPADPAMLIELADLNRSIGNIPAARSNILESVNARKSLYRTGTFEHARGLVTAAQVLAAIGDRESATKFVEEGKRSYEKSPKTSLTEQSLFELACGSALWRLGKLGEARVRLHTAADVLQQRLSRDDTASANSDSDAAIWDLLGACYQRLGIVEDTSGNLIEATRSFRIAYHFSVKAHGDKHIQSANITMSLGVASWRAENIDEALAAFRKAYEFYSHVGGLRLEAAQLCLQNLASACQDGGRHDDAIRYAKDLLRVAQAGSSRAAETHGILAEAYLAKGDVERAEYHVESARGIDAPRRKSIDAVSVELLLELGEADNARSVALKAARQLIDDPERSTSDHRRIARALAATNEYSVAASLLLHSHRTSHRALTNMISQLRVEQQQALLVMRNTYPLLRTVGFLARGRGDERVARAVAELLINCKGLASETLALQRLMVRQSTSPVQLERSKQLADVRRRIAGLSLSVSRSVASELEKLRKEEAKLSAEVANSVIQTAEYEPARWVQLDEIQQALRPDEVFVDFFKTPVFTDEEIVKRTPKWTAFRYTAVVIPSADASDSRVRLVDAGRADVVDSLVEQCLESFDSTSLRKGLNESGERLVTAQANTVLRRLAEVLLPELITERVDDVETLVISPDGGLWRIPWSALMPRENAYLVEMCNVRMVNAGRHVPYQGRPFYPSSRSVIIADPAFDVAATAPADIRQDTIPIGSNRAFRDALKKASPLPYTRAEAELIFSAVEQCSLVSPELLLGEAATEEAFRGLHSPHVLVLATHGYFLPDPDPDPDATFELGHWKNYDATAADPIAHPLLRSGLLLAGCNDGLAGGTGGGILTALEILDTDLRGTELVVLSACETGKGTVQVGEGVAGLTQAFMAAGARNVVASLWQVDDRETARLMQAFFRNYSESLRPSAAIRRAQTERIAERREKFGAAHPYFWAAFQTIGR